MVFFLSAAHRLSYIQFIRQMIRSSPVVIVFSIFLICLEYCAPLAFSKCCGGIFDIKRWESFVFFDTYTWVLFLAAPIIITKLIFREKLKDVGLMFPENKKSTLVWMAISLLFLLPWMYFLSIQKLAHIYYSSDGLSLAKFIFIQCTVLPIYYFAEEFFFRGFLFLGLWRRVGWHSFWITDVIFALAHIGKPGFEILLAIPASIILSALALKTRSIYPPVLVHTTMGMFLNISVRFF